MVTFSGVLFNPVNSSHVLAQMSKLFEKFAAFLALITSLIFVNLRDMAEQPVPERELFVTMMALEHLLLLMNA